MKKVVIFGATSAIAQAVARRFAEQGASLYLVGRTHPKLQAVKQDLQTRYEVSVQAQTEDLTRYEAHRNLIEEAEKSLGGLDVVVLAHGDLGGHELAKRDAAEALRILDVNFVSAVSLLTYVANRLEAQRCGTIAVISSVAGDRGRQSNYIYGSAKGALSLFLSGLRNRLRPAGVQVLTVKCGFVDTPMTKGFKKGILWASPATVAEGIMRAIQKRKQVVYLPWFWRGIMWVIRSIPERLFSRLKL